MFINFENLKINLIKNIRIFRKFYKNKKNQFFFNNFMNFERY